MYPDSISSKSFSSFSLSNFALIFGETGNDFFENDLKMSKIEPDEPDEPVFPIPKRGLFKEIDVFGFSFSLSKRSFRIVSLAARDAVMLA